MGHIAIETRNPAWGFWGTALRNGFDVKMSWDACAAFLMRNFGLESDAAGNLLDARFGRHLADELSFIAGGPDSVEKIEHHLLRRFEDPAWKQWVLDAMQDQRR